MTIIKYPKEGIYSICKEELSSCEKLFDSAINNTNYSVPSNFNYRGYMLQLDNLLKDYKDELTEIKDATMKVSNLYNDTEQDMINNSKSVSEYQIKKRERLIKI